MTTYVFELDIEGTTWQTGVILNPGVKPPKGNVTSKIISKVLKGTLPDYATDFLDLDPGGKFFLYYDDMGSPVATDTWRIGTNDSAGPVLTQLEGEIANDGQFWMNGDYSLPIIGPELHCFAVGKVKYKKGTFVPTSISGKLYMVSEEITSAANLTFKTVGKPKILTSGS